MVLWLRGAFVVGAQALEVLAGEKYILQVSVTFLLRDANVLACIPLGILGLTTGFWQCGRPSCVHPDFRVSRNGQPQRPAMALLGITLEMALCAFHVQTWFDMFDHYANADAGCC